MAQRADNRDGSCREVISGRHTGKWRVQYTSEDEFGRKQRLSRLFRTKTEGKDFLRGLNRGEKIEAARVKSQDTLAGWFDWLVENDWPETLADSTIAARTGRFNKYVRKEWGGVPLLLLDPIAIKSFYRSLQEGGVGKATVLELKRDLVRVFNQAIKPYHRVPWTCGNPFALTVAAPARRNAVALTPTQAVNALKCPALSSAERAMLATYLLGGLRLSEQMALTCGQILFDEDLIYVDRAVKIDRKGHQTIGFPKGNKVRLAVVCPTLKGILAEHVANMPSDAFLWPCKDGNWPKMKKRTYDSWKEIVAACKLPETMSPHDCRLSHINWIEKLMPSVSATTLKEHVGHAGVGVTEINYTRPLTPAQDLLRKELERLVGSRQKVRLAS